MATSKGYVKLGELHGIGSNVEAAECEAYQRLEYQREAAREAARYAEETVGKDVPASNRGYTRVG